MPAAGQREGRFEAGGFARVLRDLVQSFAVGRLEVETENERRHLWLDAGEVSVVTSEAEGEKLGEWLVARELLQAHEVALALLRQPEGVRFGASLVQQGRIELEQLEEEAGALAVAILAKILPAPGTYRFFEGVLGGEDEASLQLTTASLLVAAVRAIEQIERLETLFEAGSFLWGTESTLFQFQSVHLTPPEAFLLSRIDGTTSRGQLQRLVPLSAEQVTRSLAALLAAGLVEQRPAPSTRPRESVAVKLDEEEKEVEEERLQFTADEQAEFSRIVRFAAELRHRDYYSRLSLNTGATLGQIHDRFREYARLYHPDRAREPHLRSLRRELAEIHSALEEAYGTLSVPERRSKYEAAIKSGPQDPADVHEEERRQRARRELVAANKGRAQELIRSGNVGSAIPLLDQAIRIEAQGETLLLLARLEMRNPMWSQRALDHLRQAVTLEPQLTDAWLELAQFWERRKRPEKRRQCLERILAYDQDNEEALRAMAEAESR